MLLTYILKKKRAKINRYHPVEEIIVFIGKNNISWKAGFNFFLEESIHFMEITIQIKHVIFNIVVAVSISISKLVKAIHQRYLL